jgi:nucleoside-diphosphate-sugar epimerase
MIPQLLAAGHEVTAISRSPAKADALGRQGVRALTCDAFDPAGLARVVADAAPDAIIHQLTDLPARMDVRKLGEVYARNNRARREGTRNLLDAARRASVPRFIVQSMGTWYRPEGGDIKTETDPLWSDAPEPIGEAVRTVIGMEKAVLREVPDGIVLRYGGFYGPCTWYAPDGDVTHQLRRRMFPVIRPGSGITSFIHVDDAAAAAVAALGAPPGIYNVADDEPARASDWIPAFADAAGAPPPRRVPEFLARLVLGRALTAWVTTMRGASNARARAQLSWSPRYPTWRIGFRAIFRQGT